MRIFSYARDNRYASFVLAVLFALCLSLAALQVSAITSLSQGYTSDKTVAVGGLVSLIEDSADSVTAADIDNKDNLLGVVVTGASSLLSLGTGTSGEVQVATAGSEPVLVSTINGDIVRGDQITASPIAGVGMRATTNVKVIGVAQADMKKTTEETVQTDNGEKEIELGNVPVLINVGYHYKQPEKTIIPSTIQNVANALAGREVSALPIILSSVIFIVMLIVVASIVFSMIRSSIISVGRNPLSQSAVYRDVIQLSAVVIVIVASAIISIYFILRLL
jgi:hypothetical protein